MTLGVDMWTKEIHDVLDLLTKINTLKLQWHYIGAYKPVVLADIFEIHGTWNEAIMNDSEPGHSTLLEERHQGLRQIDFGAHKVPGTTASRSCPFLLWDMEMKNLLTPLAWHWKSRRENCMAVKTTQCKGLVRHVRWMSIGAEDKTGVLDISVWPVCGFTPMVYGSFWKVIFGPIWL